MGSTTGERYPVLRDQGARRFALLAPLVGSCLPTTRHRGHRPGHRGRAHRERPGAAVPVEETDDGFAGEEGTFTICSFWLVSALCEIGDYTWPVRSAPSCSLSPELSTSTARRSIPTRDIISATSRRRSPTWP